MSEARALSSEQIRGLREELDNGTTPTVWFTGSAVGVDPGRSGKVVAMEEPAEGEFLQVKPAGSKDVLSFSAVEVTLDKPAPKRKETGRGTTRKSSGTTTATESAASRTSGGATGRPEEPAPAGSTNGTASSSGSTASSGAGSKSSGKSESSGTKRASSSRSNGNGAKTPSRRPSGATIILTAGEDGQWSVEVSNGRKRVLRPTDVPASAVGQAAKALHEDVAQAVEPLLEAEREHQRARVEQLQRELDEAQRRLQELGSR
ncbi:cell wall anchor protein [Actinopolyspora erythraea]|uniref:Cell wall anchor protein n=1 Tax=Actinopolyspora erythraea TaxID=414996 RepID=A0A099D197_9ACTN|nr:DUF6319 family protein [Actinopolyspora erythraea]ASU77760.1 cell wall anchor protein [Actinopolyspora erythraea]KGI79968.1 cell wall anchor protein [Actinopolyspora erythraea]